MGQELLSPGLERRIWDLRDQGTDLAVSDEPNRLPVDAGLARPRLRRRSDDAVDVPARLSLGTRHRLASARAPAGAAARASARGLAAAARRRAGARAAPRPRRGPR